MTFKNITFDEIKSQMKSKIFYAFIIVLLIMNLIDYNADNYRLKELEKDAYYGYTHTTLEEDVLYQGYQFLSMTYIDKKIIRYIPLGSYKKLSDDQLKELGNFLESMAPGKEVFSAQRGDFQIDSATMFTYMEKLDKEVGGKTYFADKEYFYSRKTTFEEALEERNLIKEQDKFTRSYARLFADYNGIYASIFVIFIVAFSMYKDTRIGKLELHFSSNTSPLSYIGGKFTGLLISIMGVFLLFSLFETIIFIVQALKFGENIDIFAFIWTTLIWIAPTVMFCIAFAILIYLILNRFILTIIVQFLLSFYMISSTSLSGEYNLSRLIIRFNKLAPYEVFENFSKLILVNRLFYTGLSIIILGLATYVWERKKKLVLEAAEV